MAIKLPEPLAKLLQGSPLEHHILAFADHVGQILAEKQHPFFPDYTDHGIDHVNAVLSSQARLVPEDVWNAKRPNSDASLLCDADATVLIGATLLHDIAMHLRPAGFLALVALDTHFRPLPYFDHDHESHIADCPWPKLWADYLRESRRFSDRQLADIVGEESARAWKFDTLPADVGRWETNHHLVIGEFLRRHHARLAHEIAIYGFPGLKPGAGNGQFPAMGANIQHPLHPWANLIGLTARSHGTSLRLCQDYLETIHPKNPRPLGVAAIYPMALLRVADYLQLERKRAPAVLLQLHSPQSPKSLEEWTKHQAVLHIGDPDDSRAISIDISDKISHTTFLQLEELLDGLQSEIDHSTAVLDEVYGGRQKTGLHILGLSIRRVRSDLQTPTFRANLPYVPARTGFSADPNILSLLVEPLYGKEPSVGVRELMQNAIDAVRELHAWCDTHAKRVADLDLHDQEADVLIEYIAQNNGTWLFRIRDRGIGMTADTLQNYFLRAGASFRQSPEWTKEFLDADGNPLVVRSGRFGIGAFAVFLLGNSFQLRTRHVSSEKSHGHYIQASENSQLIEIQTAENLPIGTTLEVVLRDNFIKAPNSSLRPASFTSPIKETRIWQAVDWYCWNWPKVVQQIKYHDRNIIIKQSYSAPFLGLENSLYWSSIHPEGFKRVLWISDDYPSIVCNGIRLVQDSPFSNKTLYDWPKAAVQLNAPRISVEDNWGRFPLTIKRDKLATSQLPFINDLSRDVLLSYIAHSLIYGPSHFDELQQSDLHPLLLKQYSIHSEQTGITPTSNHFSEGNLRWCATPNYFVPADPWLHSLLQSSACIVFGIIHVDIHDPIDVQLLTKNSSSTISYTNCSFLEWNHVINATTEEEESDYTSIAERSMLILEELASRGIEALGIHCGAALILASSSDSSFLSNFISEGEHFSNESKEFNSFVKYAEDSNKIMFPKKSAAEDLSPMIQFLENVQNGFEANFSEKTNRYSPAVFFAAQFAVQSTHLAPETMVARIWNECLGRSTIPFDRSEREKIVRKARKNADLARHLEAWEKIVRARESRMKELLS